MAWVKRNLYFVIAVVVGLGLTGYCGYLLYSAMNAAAEASGQYATALSGLEDLRKKVPFPSKENIEAAEKDAIRVKAFLGEFRKPFSSFPAPPKVDDRQFKDYLIKCVNQFGAEATNAGVGLYPNYAFTFSQQTDKLTFPPDCIPAWMQELEEIRAILHILYKAKINFLEEIKRPAANADETYGSDIIRFPTNVQPWGVTAPYMFSFRAFSTEVANVLSGIAASSNCLIIKAIYVSPSRAPLPVMNDQPEQAPAPTPIRPTFRPPRNEFDNSFNQPDMRMQRGNDMRMERRQMTIQPPPEGAAPSGPSAPEIVLRPNPLFVTIYVDVVKLKGAEPPPAVAPVPKARMAPH